MLRVTDMTIYKQFKFFYLFIGFFKLYKLNNLMYHLVQLFLDYYHLRYVYRNRKMSLPTFLAAYPSSRKSLFNRKLLNLKFFTKRRRRFLKKRIRRTRSRFILQKRLNLNFYKYYSLKHRYLPVEVTNFAITQRLFLSKKIIKRTLWSFFYTAPKTSAVRYLSKLNSHTKTTSVNTLNNQPIKKKNYLVNANKPLAYKMRKARYAHWNLRVRGKLNEWRYNKLLSIDLSTICQNRYYTLLNLVLLRHYSFVLSWKQMLYLHKFSLILHNGFVLSDSPTLRCGDIIEMPSLLKPKVNKQNSFVTTIGRSKRKAYKEFLSFKVRGKKKDKKFPKIFKKLPMGLSKLGALIDLDPTINSFAIIYNISTFKHNLNRDIVYSSVLTLQNWRYRFD